MALSGSKCSICGKAAVEKFSPFCSKRCAMLDLGRWLGEGYKVPIEENLEETSSFPHAAEDEE